MKIKITKPTSRSFKIRQNKTSQESLLAPHPYHKPATYREFEAALVAKIENEIIQETNYVFKKS